MKIRELTRKAETLIERGKEVRQRKDRYQQAVNSARGQLAGARARLEAALAESDGEGKSDVSSARAAVYTAQALLESAERGVAEADAELKVLDKEKLDAVSQIEQYQSIGEGNLSRLDVLTECRFGNNAAGFMAELAERMNAGEQTRVKLLTSMGLAATAKKYSASKPTGSRVGPVASSLQGAKSFGDLAAYMSTKYDIQLDPSIYELDLGTVKQALSGLESVIKEFPGVGEHLKRGITSSAGVMSCTGSQISFNPEYFKDGTTLADVCREQADSGFWVPNSSVASIGVHEAAHGVEWALIQANGQYADRNAQVRAWNNCTEAGKIVSEACKNIQKTAYGRGKSSTELVRAVSGYAMTNDSETMAEAFADVYENGNNANPLSLEIKRLTKLYMNQYTGGK